MAGERKAHYADPFGNPLCGTERVLFTKLAKRPTEITCLSCKRINAGIRYRMLHGAR